MVRQVHLAIKVGYMAPLKTMKCIDNLVYLLHVHGHFFTLQVTEGFLDHKDLKVC